MFSLFRETPVTVGGVSGLGFPLSSGRVPCRPNDSTGAHHGPPGPRGVRWGGARSATPGVLSTVVGDLHEGT